MFPIQFNFVGKLLGPRGNSLKKLQDDTMTKMAVLGRGSMRNKQHVNKFLNANFKIELKIETFNTIFKSDIWQATRIRQNYFIPFQTLPIG